MLLRPRPSAAASLSQLTADSVYRLRPDSRLSGAASDAVKIPHVSTASRSHNPSSETEAFTFLHYPAIQDSLRKSLNSKPKTFQNEPLLPVVQVPSSSSPPGKEKPQGHCYLKHSNTCNSRTLRQEDFISKASLDYVVRPYSNKQTEQTVVKSIVASLSEVQG